MAMIKVFSVDGVKELNCFDTLTEVPYLPEDEAEDFESDDGELLVSSPIRE